MGVARKWVFPIVRILIFAAIAIALVKLAFFAGVTQASDPTLPTGQISEPQTTVALGTITNDVKLKGTVSADAAVSIKATLAGEVKKVLVAQGQAVAVNTPVLTIRSDTMSQDGTPITKTVTVLAGSAGALSSFPVIVGQVVAVGDSLGQVAPPSFNVSATLSAEQQYRLLNQPTEAQVTITGGPAPFTCTGFTITTALAGAGSGSASGQPSDSGSSNGGTTVKCAVPADVKVFSGLAANLTISGGVADKVLVVPITAVEGTIQSGNVYTMAENGKPEKHPVTLGLSDGKNVEITGGVKEGDQILEFVPGAPAASGGDCKPMPDGSDFCQSSP